jgi:hypothetical protein
MLRDDTGGQFSGWPSVQAREEDDAAIVHRAGFKQEYWGDWSQRQACANARYIALAHPAAVLALLEQNERMREALKVISDLAPEKWGHHVNNVKWGDVARAALGDGA